MQKISIDDIQPDPHDEYHTDRRPLSEPLGTTDFAITRYVLQPGERFSGSVHAHMDQEEVFVVLEGDVTFETRTGAVTVSANEAIRFGPGDFQSGANDGDRPVVAIALGAPRETTGIKIDRIPVLDDRDITCPDCGHDHMRIPSEPETEADPGLVCPECAARLIPESES